MSTWFSGRIVSTLMRGFRRNFWITTPSRNRRGIATKSETYGSTPIVLRTKVTYIASIINCPWARLMIPMTPMIRVIPIPIRAYSPPLRIPATRVCRKTSMASPALSGRVLPPANAVAF